MYIHVHSYICQYALYRDSVKTESQQQAFDEHTLTEPRTTTGGKRTQSCDHRAHLCPERDVGPPQTARAKLPDSVRRFGCIQKVTRLGRHRHCGKSAPNLRENFQAT